MPIGAFGAPIPIFADHLSLLPTRMASQMCHMQLGGAQVQQRSAPRACLTPFKALPAKQLSFAARVSTSAAGLRASAQQRAACHAAARQALTCRAEISYVMIKPDGGYCVGRECYTYSCTVQRKIPSSPPAPHAFLWCSQRRPRSPWSHGHMVTAPPTVHCIACRRAAGAGGRDHLSL